MDFADPRMCMMPDAEPSAPAAPAPTHERHEEESNPVETALKIADYGHLAGDAAVDGHVATNSMGGMFTEMGEDAAKIWQGEGTAAQTAMKGATAIAAPLAIGGGIMETVEGVHKMRHGDMDNGVLQTVEGGSTATSGVLGLTGLASGFGATMGPALGSFATGMEIGHFGDEQAKELGVFHDAQGRAESASDWASENGASADNWVARKTGSKGLGTAAGLAATGISSIAGAGVAAGSAIAGGAKKLWDWL